MGDKIRAKQVETDIIIASGANPFTGDQSMGGNKLTSVASGVSPSDAVNLAQLNSAVTGLSWKNPARAGSTGPVVLAAMPPTVDGSVPLVLGDRFLAKDQGLPEENGLYDFNGVGLPATRTADADTAAELEGAAVLVKEGPNAGTCWQQTFDGIILGVTPVTWVQFDVGAVVPGDGLTKTGNIVDVGAGPGIQVNADDVEVVYGVGGEVLDIQPDDVGAAGVLDKAARVDHVHPIVTDVPVDVAQINSEGAATSFARSDHVHSHGNQPLGDGLDHALVTADPGGVAGFMSPADKATLVALNPGPTGFCWGRTVFVDSECGDDSTGARGDASRAFLTLAAAAIAAGITSGDIIWLRPGTFTMTADFTIPIGVTVHGMDKARVRIERLGAVAPATLITMAVDSALYDVTLRLTGGSNLATSLRGINFPGATGSTARLKNVLVEVDNGGVVAVVDSTEVIGVRVGSTGTPSKYHAAMEDVEIFVTTKGNGKKRCLLLESSGGTVNARNVNALLERQGAAPGVPNYIAVEIDQISATLYLQDGSSEVSPAAAGADVSQTSGTLQLESHLLVTNNANAKSFTAFEADEEVWSVSGLVTSGAVTRFVRPGSAVESTVEIQRRVSRPIIVFGLALLARLHAGVPGSQTTTVTVRKNGVDTLVLVALPDGTTTIAFTANASVSFADGDLLSVKIVSTGTLAATDVQASLKSY